MTAKMVITIPNYRTPSRNSTATKHWRNYQSQRNEISSLIKAYMPNIGGKLSVSPAVVTIEAFYKGKRGVDTSNLDDKIIVDGLMHAGILENDTAVENPVVIKKCFLNMGFDTLSITIEKL